jgi:uncharacterized protein (TIGR00106 family)
MRTIADIQVEPIGGRVSTQEYVRKAVHILAGYGVRVHVHKLGIEIEGDLDMIVQALPRVHRALHVLGAERIHSSMRMETRTDVASGNVGVTADVKPLVAGA